MIKYKVNSSKDLAIVIAHFDKYPLITQKQADFLLFKEAFSLFSRKEHLTSNGLQQIVNLRASINTGLSSELKAAFPNTIPVPRPLVELSSSINPYWLAGFVSGDGCFQVKISKSVKSKLGFSVALKFQITQHSRDAELMRNFISYLGCGKYYQGTNRENGNLEVQMFSDVIEKIIPFFDQYPILGVKGLDYADFKKVGGMMKAGRHLTQEGLEEIRKIQTGINTGRSW